MFRKQLLFASPLLTASILAFALAASPAAANNAKDINTSMDILTATSLGGKPVKPGTYQVVVDGSTVTLKQGRKVIAQAPAEWKDGSDKASYSTIVTNNGAIKEFHFEGKSNYVEVSN